MPPDGHTSITVTVGCFDRFDALYQEHKKNGTLPPGIFSFAAFFVYKFETQLQENRHLEAVAFKIKHVPKNCNAY